MEENRMRKSECGVRNGKALSRGQMAEDRVLNAEFGMQKVERKMKTEF